MELFDAHAHLAAPEFADDLPEVLARALAAGVCGILTVGETLADAERILALADRFPLIKPAAGFDPTSLDRDAAQAVIAFGRRHADRLVAIGEVGLDHWIVKAAGDWRIQEIILAELVALANELDVPLSIHSRSAGRHTIALLKACGARRVVLHAFDGKAGSALEGIDAGYAFSIPPSVVRSPQKQKLVRLLPLGSLLLETDSPVLGPTPGERNEPANVAIACRAVAALKGISPETVARVTTENARRWFSRAFA
jgi:TatD DNase family protein